MRIAIKAPDKGLEITEIENTLEAMQKAVGGYIEVIDIGGGVVLVVDEDGKMKGKEPNFYIGNDFVVGTVLFVSAAGEEFASLTDMQIKILKEMFE